MCKAEKIKSTKQTTSHNIVYPAKRDVLCDLIFLSSVFGSSQKDETKCNPAMAGLVLEFGAGKAP